jgi:hypothetical protein
MIAYQEYFLMTMLLVSMVSAGCYGSLFTNSYCGQGDDIYQTKPEIT